MPMIDPIADMLSRLRNAQAQHHAAVRMPSSKMKQAILEVLAREGYINGYTVEETERGHKEIVVSLKYHQGQPVLTTIKRVSTPGRRIYSQATEIPMVSNGLGITIVSTSKGVLTDTQAREQKVGGEVICQVM